MKYEECSDNSTVLRDDALCAMPSALCALRHALCALTVLSCKRIASLRAESISEVEPASSRDG